MSAQFLKKALGDANIRVTTNRDGERQFSDGHNSGYQGGMDTGGEIHSRRGVHVFRGQPRMIGRYMRGNRNGSRGGGRVMGSYQDHDDRTGISVTQRLGERMGYKGRGRDQRGRRGGSPRYRGQNYRSNVAQADRAANEVRWYRVTIPYGKKVSKEFIFSAINELLELPFNPQMFEYEGEAAVFYVEMTRSSSEALQAISKRITLPNGFKMVIIVRSSELPVPKAIEGELLAKLTETLSHLYDIPNRVLNLTEFHKNSDLKPTCLPLARHNVMAAIVGIITEHIPEITGLILKGNRLSMLDQLAKLVPSTPALTALDLSCNEIREGELDKLKQWKLTEINLQDTPFSKRFSNTAEYLSAVRKKFPKIIKLDGETAPIPVGFDLEDELELPARKGSYFCSNAQVQDLVSRFLTQYFDLFDSANRDQLLDAYHENATVSLSFWFYPGSERQPGLENMKQISRNLKAVGDIQRRSKFLKRGKIACVSAWTQDLPKTKHLLDTLSVDVVHQSPSALVFTVTGLFEEQGSRVTDTTRLFSRTFVTVPQGAGIAIISEQLSLSNALKPRKEAILAAARGRAVAPPPVAPHQLDAARQAMVQQFMAQSTMNAHWSTECLLQNAWDFNKAAQMFTALKNEGKIPPEAFVHSTS